MKILETIFLALSIIVPVLFILLLLFNFKRFEKSRKVRIRLLSAIVLSFLVNFAVYEVIKIYFDKEEPKSEVVEKKKVNTPKVEENKDTEETTEEEKETEENTSTLKKQEEKKTETNTKTETKTETKSETKTETKSETQPETKPSTQEQPINSTSVSSKGYTIETRNGVTYVDGYLIANKTYPLPESYVPTGTHKSASASTGTCADCITEETYQAYVNMINAASEAGYSMWNQSGYRSYNYQKALYDGYVKSSGKTAADTYSARPGHSEHQTGLAFDICSKGYSCISSGFNGTPPANWLANNCYKYGFILRYPKDKDNETGYKYESWHFRYVGVDLATKLYNDGNWITLESYFGITSKYAN